MVNFKSKNYFQSPFAHISSKRARHLLKTEHINDDMGPIRDRRTSSSTLKWKLLHLSYLLLPKLSHRLLFIFCHFVSYIRSTAYDTY